MGALSVNTSQQRGIRIVLIAASILFFFTLAFHSFGSEETKSYLESKKDDWLPSSKSSIKARLEQSERYYQETISERRWLMSQYTTKEHTLFPCKDPAMYGKMPFSVWDFLPAAFNCPHSTRRIGRLGDGGKWICGAETLAKLPATRPGPLRKDLHLRTSGKSPVARVQAGCVIYSFGVRDESSFEVEMLKKFQNCQVWGYDFSVDGFGPQMDPAESYERAHFAKIGIGGTTDLTRSPPFVSVQDLMANNGHDHIDILKIDIEGYEFQTFTSLLNYYISRGEQVPVAQIVVEVHLFEKQGEHPGNVDVMLEWWELFESAGFRPVWTEPNLLVSIMHLEDGMPRYSEYTFINTRDDKSSLLR
ncbi:hypothetical protein K461DRAFT_323733 [Myriangium duriaei CBS 260.36]|uniref:Methyltransferase domain-containing protein n=1 Tax=Myriangium duriaei CBS 260.36 TaxID=1168546 RepID=A0A9P4IWW7_9PEZI|nr:hypothetical protein K461DRAFT_323733 [Myriangium duriaei CBS 260.36]